MIEHKISIIGAGNVGSIAALQLLSSGCKELVLVDVAGAITRGKALDLEDACSLLGSDTRVYGTDDIRAVKDSGIIVITAGLARKPGMTREDLLQKNAQILKEIALSIRSTAPGAVVVVVTNPLDVMTYLVLKVTGFPPQRVMGMGMTLDAARFGNLISVELNAPRSRTETQVIGCHGEGMLPLSRLSAVSGMPLQSRASPVVQDTLTKRTVDRGKEIVSLLGSTSAYFAPGTAVAQLVSSIARNGHDRRGVSAFLRGEYGITDVCMGVPCIIGGKGIEKIEVLDLNDEELTALRTAASALRQSLHQLPL
jgi:malate dehydrogenase